MLPSAAKAEVDRPKTEDPEYIHELIRTIPIVDAYREVERMERYSGATEPPENRRRRIAYEFLRQLNEKNSPLLIAVSC